MPQYSLSHRLNFFLASEAPGFPIEFFNFNYNPLGAKGLYHFPTFFSLFGTVIANYTIELKKQTNNKERMV
jgi:hypothetical protein